MNPALSKILADLDVHRHLFDLDEDGLGKKLLAAAIDGVKETIAAEETPDGEPWDQLSPAYEAEKSRTHPGEPMAFLERLMTAEDELQGDQDVTATEASVTYGRSEAARVEAEWFSEGSEDNNQPPRPFFGLTKASEAASKAILDERFATIR